MIPSDDVENESTGSRTNSPEPHAENSQQQLNNLDMVYQRQDCMTGMDIDDCEKRDGEATIGWSVAGVTAEAHEKNANSRGKSRVRNASS